MRRSLSFAPPMHQIDVHPLVWNCLLPIEIYAFSFHKELGMKFTVIAIYHDYIYETDITLTLCLYLSNSET